MELRLKIGRYAGEIRDFEPADARQMIADGRAADPRFEDEVKPQATAPIAEVLAELPQPPIAEALAELPQPAPVAEVHVPAPRARRSRRD